MKILGIVMEANPFHNGHLHFINECKKQLNPDVIIAITSTSFTMRGEISLLNKFDKTNVLLNHGVDIVLELPFPQATQSADYFSHASVLNLSNIGITDLAFGCEVDDINLLNKYVDIITSSTFKKDLEEKKNFDMSYKNTFSSILSTYLSEDELDIFNKPNVTLAIQYLKTIKENALHITPHIIKRINSDYRDQTITSNIASATAIRHAINNKENFSNTLPKDSYELLINYVQAKENFLNIIKYNYQLNSTSNQDIEGLNNYISNNGDFTSLEALQQSLKNKRYSINRINRQILYKLLNIDNNYQYYPYVRILGINQKGLEYIKVLPKDTKELIFSGTKELKNANAITKDINLVELKATKLYSIITNNELLNKKEQQLPIIRKD